MKRTGYSGFVARNSKKWRSVLKPSCIAQFLPSPGALYPFFSSHCGSFSIPADMQSFLKGTISSGHIRQSADRTLLTCKGIHQRIFEWSRSLRNCLVYKYLAQSRWSHPWHRGASRCGLGFYISQFLLLIPSEHSLRKTGSAPVASASWEAVFGLSSLDRALKSPSLILLSIAANTVL